LVQEVSLLVLRLVADHSELASLGRDGDVVRRKPRQGEFDLERVFPRPDNVEGRVGFVVVLGPVIEPVKQGIETNRPPMLFAAR
jgi:hypothetical protein